MEIPALNLQSTTYSLRKALAIQSVCCEDDTKEMGAENQLRIIQSIRIVHLRDDQVLYQFC